MIPDMIDRSELFSFSLVFSFPLFLFRPCGLFFGEFCI